MTTTPRATEPILSLSGVSVRFGGVIACDDVSFDVQRGELFALIGPNGAGKTSVVNTITGVYAPEPGGTVTYTDPDGHAHQLVGRKPHRIVRLGIGRSFQNLGLFPKLSVLDNVLLGRYIHGRTGIIRGGLFTPGAVADEVEQTEAAEEIVELLDITQHRHDPVGDLPYGLQKRVELARCLALRPNLLLLDEPMAGMTLEEKQDIIDFIFRIRADLRVTVLLIEHDMAVVMAISDRVMVLDFGRTLAVGSPSKVQADPAVIEAYLGAS